MSGIAGIVRLDGGPVDRDLLSAMTRFQAFRGPDAQNQWADGCAGLSHTLLRQDDAPPPPAIPASLDGAVWITANARVDAREELIAALRAAGREVEVGTSDARLLLHAYHAWDLRCLERLLGDFAFAIWDSRRRRLFCAVDHFGVRPLYYARHGDEVVFSDTQQCLRLHRSATARLDEISVGDYLLFGQLQDAHRTMFAQVERLAAGHFLIASPEGVATKRYWSIPEVPERDDRDAGEVVETFLQTLREATRDRLRSRNVAIYMSGGLDSPLVALAATHALAQGAQPWHAFAYTCAFLDLIPDEEGTLANEVASTLGIPQETHDAGAFAPLDWVERCPWLPPQPPQPAWSTFVSDISNVAGRCRLALTGWDGDAPLRAQLPHHWRALFRSGRWRRTIGDMAHYVVQERGLPPVGLRSALQRFSRGVPRWLKSDFVRRTDLEARLRLNAQRRRRAPFESRRDHLQARPWRQLFEEYDPGWHGLPVETAHPLVDLRLMRFFLSLPPVPWCLRKELLRRACEGVLPSHVVRRPKTGVASGFLRAAALRNGMPRQRLKTDLQSVADYLDPSGFPSMEGVDWIDDSWNNLHPLSLASWMRRSDVVGAAHV